MKGSLYFGETSGEKARVITSQDLTAVLQQKNKVFLTSNIQDCVGDKKIDHMQDGVAIKGNSHSVIRCVSG
jgi:hypothetical protein